MFVPEGHLKIAQRFNAGLRGQSPNKSRRDGRKSNSNTQFSFVPSGLDGFGNRTKPARLCRRPAAARERCDWVAGTTQSRSVRMQVSSAPACANRSLKQLTPRVSMTQCRFQFHVSAVCFAGFQHLIVAFALQVHAEPLTERINYGTHTMAKT
jgi:hypothetical protein